MKKFIQILIYTFIIEGITAFFRFGLGKESTKDTAFLKHLTFGYRIHHGYIGLLALLLLPFFKLPGKTRNILVILGWALVLSDLTHHFLVLWPITGSPQFDIKY